MNNNNQNNNKLQALLIALINDSNNQISKMQVILENGERLILQKGKLDREEEKEKYVH